MPPENALANWVTVDTVGQSNACRMPARYVAGRVRYGAQRRSQLKSRRHAPVVVHVSVRRHAVSAASVLRADRRPLAAIDQTLCLAGS